MNRAALQQLFRLSEPPSRRPQFGTFEARHFFSSRYFRDGEKLLDALSWKIVGAVKGDSSFKVIQLDAC